MFEAHALFAGVLMEGIGCVLLGIWGSGSGTTSYSQNIGAIAITRVDLQLLLHQA